MQPPKVEIGHRVMLEWIDSASDRGWSMDVSPSLAVVRSVGIAVGCDESAISITTSVMNNGGCHSTLSIPWCAIVVFEQYEKVCEMKSVFPEPD